MDKFRTSYYKKVQTIDITTKAEKGATKKCAKRTKNRCRLCLVTLNIPGPKNWTG